MLGHQQTIKIAKSVVALMFLIILWVSVASIEYDVAMRFRILSSMASVGALIVMVGALLRAPAGYEDETGFHIGVLVDALQ